MAPRGSPGLALCLCLLALGGARAQQWMATLDGAKQVPPLTDAETGGAMGMFTLWATADGGLEYSLEVTGIQNLTMGHIHVGNSSESGPVAVVLVPEGGMVKDGAPPMLSPPVSGAFSVDRAPITAMDVLGMSWEEFLDAADDEGLYANLHSEQFPGGVIRGQLMPVPGQTWGAELSGDNQMPPVDTATAGNFSLTEGADGTFSWTLSVSGATNVTMAHIHAGNASASGPVVLGLVPTDGSAMLEPPQSGDLAYSGTFTAADLQAGWTAMELRDALRFDTAQALYINVHSAEFPGGVVRGQLMWTGAADMMAGAPAMAPMGDSMAPTPMGTTSAAQGPAVGRAAALLVAAALAALLL